MTVRTLLAASLTSAATPLEQQVRAARAAGADLAELRVDCIGDIPAVTGLLEAPRILPLIVTVRCAAEGGAWTGSEAERVALIERLGLLRPGYIDVEYATWRRSANIRQKIGQVCNLAGAGAGAHEALTPGQRPKNELILSHHDLAGTPTAIASLLDELAASPAGIIKVAFTARDAADACRVLSELCRRRGSARQVIALAMGECGVATRILARKFGAYLTYAALRRGEEAAAGQPTIADLKQIYGWERIGPATRVYGVVAWPVAHSQSPHVHNAALTADGIDGVYVPWAVRPDYEGFAAFMDYVAREPGLGIAGLSVTLPHKEHALRWLDERGLAAAGVAPRARRCGAVNTLALEFDGRWVGDNTDGLGALAALQTVQRYMASSPAGQHVAVLGAGGAARAIVAALCAEGCQVTVYNRTPQRAQALARELRCAWQPWAERVQYVGEVLINCTSLGMWPAVDETPVPDAALRAGMVVLDAVYRPAETHLLRAARSRGCEVVGGAVMFIGQAAGQYELWHHRPAPVEVMRRALPADAG